MEYFEVVTNGYGLHVRIVRDTDTTVYADRTVATFDTWEEAKAFENANDADPKFNYGWEA